MLRRVMMAENAASGGDPYWANVVSLLHYAGSDGSTTFTDQNGRVWTPAGDAQIDTAQSPFGESSGLFDGTGDYINTPSSSDFAYGTGDFTWETWVRFASVSGNQYILDHGSNGGVLQLSGGFLKYYNSTTGIYSPLYTDGGGGVSTGTWYHIAVSRASGVTRYFRDGVLQSSATDGHNYAAQSLRLGSYGGGLGYGLNGWLAETRITKGVARYTASFTPPTAPFPNS